MLRYRRNAIVQQVIEDMISNDSFHQMDEICEESCQDLALFVRLTRSEAYLFPEEIDEDPKEQIKKLFKFMSISYRIQSTPFFDTEDFVLCYFIINKEGVGDPGKLIVSIRVAKQDGVHEEEQALCEDVLLMLMKSDVTKDFDARYLWQYLQKRLSNIKKFIEVIPTSYTPERSIMYWSHDIMRNPFLLEQSWNEPTKSERWTILLNSGEGYYPRWIGETRAEACTAAMKELYNYDMFDARTTQYVTYSLDKFILPIEEKQ